MGVGRNGGGGRMIWRGGRESDNFGEKEKKKLIEGNE